ncbi:DUF1905 domain-containing protein [Demequina aestuarii]|uniref:DUF1905 domain-containing protein n=1 Tax=Demequina aestuarii TaxID=327095 RepID=UPI000781285E|nr:DUF1905 domain-containing protein [Demequina aestuarii]
MAHEIGPLDHTFTAPIGVEVKSETWACVEMPDSAEFFGTGKSVKVDAEVDGVALENVGFMPTGRGGHMVSLSAKVRKQLGKDIGDEVTVSLTRRLT